MIWISANHTSIQYPTKILKKQNRLCRMMIAAQPYFYTIPTKNEFVKIWANVWLEKNEHG